ncbi:ParB/RepB/Spo0J family partition protein [Oceanomicrobium pacificus]|uniref:ParB/RepB/Spo0J family partition protein n=1 Tax=Oceanomicrobium pacificus TaxID=2692916 RepID=A0A6B0TPW2_9RHOB|nr:ParB/RepB/Spo0J family partition protein [Oceanomicrobium pacificus]MXU64709.1 ParB/RepB/Spo0J family partition protein [Oceanomicrobium pacificus]
MSQKPAKKGLGRGLSALLADVDLGGDAGANTPAQATGGAPRGELRVPIEHLSANPDQPRRDFSEADLADLTASIREKGVLQPLIVRPDPGAEGHYQIVAGERRWRAAQRAQLHDLPVLVRDLDDTEVLEVGIIENIQRADLNAVEEAMGYRQLMDRFGHTQEKLAEALGKSRSHIANLLRLLNLPEPVLALLRDGRLSAGHARALVPADDPHALAREVVSRGLSVRQTEQLVKAEGAPKPARKTGGAPAKDADTKALEETLKLSVGLPVAIHHKPDSEKGELRISYSSLDELDALCDKLSQGG